MRTRVVFVHGIGPPRDVEREHAGWTTALADGAQRAGHAAFADELRDGAVDTVFVHYGDLFRAGQAHGGGDDLGAAEAQLLQELLTDVIDEQLVDAGDPELRRVLAHARAELVPRAGAQGAGAPVRRAINAATALLSYPPPVRLVPGGAGGVHPRRGMAQRATAVGRTPRCRSLGPRTGPPGQQHHHVGPTAALPAGRRPSVTRRDGDPPRPARRRIRSVNARCSNPT